MKYSAEFFLTSTGRSPVEEFLETLDMKSQKKFLYVRSLLEEFGPRLPFPFCKRIRDAICELRFTGREGAIRIMYFFYCDNRIVFTNGFIKKTQKSPPQEITIALMRRKLFLEAE